MTVTKSELLFKSVDSFFKKGHNSQILIDVLEKRKGVSLRNLEWFITNYSKSKNLSYKTNSGQLFTVHCAYKSSLDGYSKKLFDPFCRASKFEYEVPNVDGTKIHTTVAQLNFIKWCITNNIIDYIISNKDDIKKKNIEGS